MGRPGHDPANRHHHAPTVSAVLSVRCWTVTRSWVLACTAARTVTRCRPDGALTHWVYLRFHGVNAGGNYTRQALRAQTRQIEQYLGYGLDVFAYFNNDAHGYAVQNAADLRRFCEGKLNPP